MNNVFPIYCSITHKIYTRIDLSFINRKPWPLNYIKHRSRGSNPYRCETPAVRALDPLHYVDISSASKACLDTWQYLKKIHSTVKLKNLNNANIFIFIEIYIWWGAVDKGANGNVVFFVEQSARIMHGGAVLAIRLPRQQPNIQTLSDSSRHGKHATKNRTHTHTLK